MLSDPNVAGKVDTEHHLTGHTSKWLKVTRRLGQRAFLGDAGKLAERAREVAWGEAALVLESGLAKALV